MNEFKEPLEIIKITKISKTKQIKDNIIADMPKRIN